jgi:hypothetical protein
LVAAPGRFSLTKGWSRRSESHWAIKRPLLLTNL